MAVNPHLAASGGMPFPAPYAGEYICCSRDGVDLEVDGLPRGSRFSGPGAVFVTNYRLVFVPRKPTAQVQALELPLLLISAEDVKQPIFGSNFLGGVCRLVDAPPNSAEGARFKLKFTSGGMGTLVPLFYAALAFIRTASRLSAVQAQAPPTPDAEPPSFLQAALVDPSDPTRIFLTTQVELQEGKPPGFPVA